MSGCVINFNMRSLDCDNKKKSNDLCKSKYENHFFIVWLTLYCIWKD